MGTPIQVQTSEHYERVRLFMRKVIEARKAAGLPAGELQPTPHIPPLELRALRARLLLEEVLELIKALGIEVIVGDKNTPGVRFNSMQDCTLDCRGEPDLVAIADGIADVSVVNIGTAIECGIKDVALLEAVDANNLAKFAPGHRIENGKLIKPPGFKPPDIKAVLDAQVARQGDSAS